MRAPLPIVCVATVLAAGLAAPLAADGSERRASTRADAGTQEPGLPSVTELDPIHDALESGLAYLARQQALTGDGSLTLGEETEHDSPIGVTALAALAWMSGGSGPGRGPYQREVSAAVDYLLSHQVPEGDALEGYVTDERDRQSRTHGHGLATLALAEAYSTSPGSPRGRRIAKALELCVRRIETAQGVDGGWFYSPLRTVEMEGSVTIALVQGLRGARNVGVYVETQVITRAIEYVKSLQAEDGGFQYSRTEPRTSVALTAASLSTLHAIGVYDGPEVKNAYDYVWRELAKRRLDEEAGRYTNQPAFPFYERFYLSQALWQHPDERVFRDWARDETRRVLSSQEKDGSWLDRRWAPGGTKIVGRYGKAYATAMNCLFLALPEGLLPIFQR